MNCEDILELLDNGDLDQPGTLAKGGVAAHLDTCPDCAAQWDAQRRFSLLPYALPAADFVARCRRAVITGAVTRPTPSRRPYVMAGAIACAGAAAAALVLLQPGPAPGTALPAVVADGISASSVPAAPVSPGVRPDTAAPVHTAASQAPSAPPFAAAAFAVRVMPLEVAGTDALGRAAAAEFHAALLEELGRIPGLELRSLAAEDDGHADYVVSVRVDAPGPGNTLRAMTRVRIPPPNAVVVPIAGEFSPDCVVVPGGRCADARALAQSLVPIMRSMAFSRALPRQALIDRLGNATLDPEQRLEALQSLASPRVVQSAGGARIAPDVEVMRDPAVERGAIDLARSGNAAQRAQVWRLMRGVQSPGMVDPLISAAVLDVEESVRVQAISTLLADHAGNAQVRDALQSVARRDASPLVRALAQRAVAGEDAWLHYLDASLQDMSLTTEQRLQPLFVHLNESGGLVGHAGLRAAASMDDGSMRALASTLSEALSSPASRQAFVVISHLEPFRHPAITQMLLAAARREGAWIERLQVFRQLEHRIDDEGVRAELELIASGDPVPQIRDAARDALAQEAR